MAKLTKRFDTYRDATLWLHERGYSAAMTFTAHTGECTVTLEGEQAIRAAEEETNTRILKTEAA